MVKTKMSAFHVRGHVCHTWNLLRFISSDKSRYHKKCTCLPLSYTSDLFLEVCPNSFWDRTVHQRNERMMPHDDGAGTGRDRLARKPTKENEQSPNGRCRRVAKEYKIFEKPDLCASTRPPEAFKFRYADTATDSQKDQTVAIIDFRRAYFDAPCTRNVFVERPSENLMQRDEDMCDVLCVSVSDMSDAAKSR